MSASIAPQYSARGQVTAAYTVRTGPQNACRDNWRKIVPYDLDVNPSKGRLYAKATGKLTVDDIRSCFNQSVSNRNFIPSLPHLVDLREAKYTPADDDDDDEMIKTLKLLAYALKGKIAIVTANQAIYLMGKLLSVRGENVNLAIDVFAALVDAYEWLGLTP